MSRLTRRQFLAGAAWLGLVAGCGRVPHPETPQARVAVRRIGVLGLTPAAPADIDSFRQGLRDLGWIEGENVMIDWRSQQGEAKALPALAAELVHLPVDVIVVQGQGVASRVAQATSTIPIVQMSGVDLVAAGLVASLARPGGNVTGMTNVTPELTAKRLELLKQTAPGISRVLVLAPLSGPGSAAIVREAERAASVLDIEMDSLPMNGPDDLDRALDYTRSRLFDGLAVGTNEVTLPQRGRIIALAREMRLPVMYTERRFVEDGGLMAYAPNLSDSPRRAAVFVDKLLRGASPADLPVERPMRFDFVVNMKSARELGITFPHEVALQITEVIDG